MSAHHDPLRRLLDAVLDEDSRTLAQMAERAFISPFHLTRTVSESSGEAPVALRRRVTLEQAAWSLQRGAAVTETAFASGYDSVEGFTRAFRRAYGHPPTAMPPPSERGHWLPAPNGIHFHSPTTLYVDAGLSHEQSSGDVLALLVQHDLDDIAALTERHRRTAPRWLAMVRDVERRDAWQDRIVDALCEPPESFLLSQILAHELTYSSHRRLLARWMLTDAGIDATGSHLDPDPIIWHRRRTGESS